MTLLLLLPPKRIKQPHAPERRGAAVGAFCAAGGQHQAAAGGLDAFRQQQRDAHTAVLEEAVCVIAFCTLVYCIESGDAGMDAFCHKVRHMHIHHLAHRSSVWRMSASCPGVSSP